MQKLFQSESNKLDKLKNKDEREVYISSGPHRLNIICLLVWKDNFLARLIEWKNICKNICKNLNAKE